MVIRMNRREIYCLCPACRQNFYDTDAYLIARVSCFQLEREPCTYCGMRLGYDYYVTPLRSTRLRRKIHKEVRI